MKYIIYIKVKKTLITQGAHVKVAQCWRTFFWLRNAVVPIQRTFELLIWENSLSLTCMRRNHTISTKSCRSLWPTILHTLRCINNASIQKFGNNFLPHASVLQHNNVTFFLESIINIVSTRYPYKNAALNNIFPRLHAPRNLHDLNQ